MFIGLLKACTIRSFSESLVPNLKRPIKYVSLNNQKCKARPPLVNINYDETIFYPFTASVNNCGGNCNTIDDSFSPVCISNKVKNMSLTVFNLISGLYRARFFSST